MNYLLFLLPGVPPIPMFACIRFTVNNLNCHDFSKKSINKTACQYCFANAEYVCNYDFKKRLCKLGETFQPNSLKSCACKPVIACAHQLVTKTN